MTQAVEPPQDVTDCPMSVVLTEDIGFYETSWGDTFAAVLPKNHGIRFRQFSLSPDTANFDQALQEMTNDIRSVASADTILVTRGPWMSWQACFYLQELPLSGLVMVDPMQLDDMNGVNQFELQYEKLGLQNSVQYKLYREFSEHWDHWSCSLKIQPGAVPAMVMYTNVRPGYRRCAENTALRHGNIPVIKVDSKSPSHAEESAAKVAEWVENLFQKRQKLKEQKDQEAAHTKQVDTASSKGVQSSTASTRPVQARDYSREDMNHFSLTRKAEIFRGLLNDDSFMNSREWNLTETEAEAWNRRVKIVPPGKSPRQDDGREEDEL